MAATDKPYRSQKALDIVFAASCILLLVSIVGMFMQDYFREYKAVQRKFRDVKPAVHQRLAADALADAIVDAKRFTTFVQSIPRTVKSNQARLDKHIFKALKDGKIKLSFDSPIKTLVAARKKRQNNAGEIAKFKEEIAANLPNLERANQQFQTVDAELTSKNSFYDIEVEHHSANSARAKSLAATIKELQAEHKVKKANKDKYETVILEYRNKIQSLEKELTDASSQLTRATEKFVTQVNTVIQSTWDVGDWVRTLPIVDGFASPLKIHQYTINDIPIDYNFMHVTRFDRCKSCHQAIDNPVFTKDRLRSLAKVDFETKVLLTIAKIQLQQLREESDKLPKKIKLPDPEDLQLTKLKLSEGEINQFCAHPRLDLYVGPNSAHPAEKFGCTSCHSGQGSATSFNLASHTPNDSKGMRQWKEKHGWEPIHYWDFPMLPNRFVESSCLKCHYEVTDLITAENRNEAPKLLHGYDLLRSFGCFGCHEIQGRKKGRPVGPDIRLETIPPLEELLPEEQEKLTADPNTAPGNMRKVGPSLYRISEKTNKQWIGKWILAPRSFRPDTKMPHYYGLSNNDPSVLPKDQKKFPNAEIYAISHYLFNSSVTYIDEIKTRKKDSPEQTDKDMLRLTELISQQLHGTLGEDDHDKKAALAEIERLRYKVRLQKAAVLKDLAPADDKRSPEDVKLNGRMLFVERGCLACHRHEATTKSAGGGAKLKDKPWMVNPKFMPPITSDAQFGPNLSQLRAKLVDPNDSKKSLEKARIWLQQWIKDPHVYSPRSRMPVTHLNDQEVADVAAWLLDQKASELGDDWNSLKVTEPKTETLQNLARVYLKRLMPASTIRKLFGKEKVPDYIANGLPTEEKELAKNYSKESLLRYVGKKAIGRLGCFGCHDVPGFDTTKPIGVGLNEWGKKDAARLSFGDIDHYLNKHFVTVDKLVTKNGNPLPAKVVRKNGKIVAAAPNAKNAKEPYEKFFYDSLHHRHREGYLNQKLIDPRSYDYKKILSWDDRSRMPQFKFSRIIAKPGESKPDYAARKMKTEADDREAIMTFVLGLVAEPVPMKMVHQPKNDHLALVKGRQILEKYNCAGCHLIQPSVFEIEVNREITNKLQSKYTAYEDYLKSGNAQPFIREHDNWNSDLPAEKSKLKMFGIDAAVENKLLRLSLSHAVRFFGKKSVADDDGKVESRPAWLNVPASEKLALSNVVPVDSSIGPLDSQAKLEKYLASHGQYGGAFASLLADYLIARDEQRKPNDFFKKGQEGNALAAGPPVLLYQGERTQTDWLYRFLLNPTKIRQITVLQMPRFNMSKEEAQTLVHYFAAVTRLSNPSLGVSYPSTKIPQQDLQSEYWKQKNAAYLKRLETRKVVGKDQKIQTLKDQKLEELRPIWKNIVEKVKEKHARLKAQLATADTEHSAVQKQREKIEAEQKKINEQLKALKKGDDKTKQDLTKQLQGLEKQLEPIKHQAELAKTRKEILASRLAEVTEQLSDYSLENQEKNWLEVGAYQTDSFRMLSNNLCLNCHKIGPLIVKNQMQGPALDLAWKRLRPGWTEHWIANPRVFLHGSPMPPNFKLPAQGPYIEFQDFFTADTPMDQITAIRDALMAYPILRQTPVNQRWLLPQIGEKK